MSRNVLGTCFVLLESSVGNSSRNHIPTIDLGMTSILIYNQYELNLLVITSWHDLIDDFVASLT